MERMAQNQKSFVIRNNTGNLSYQFRYFGVPSKRDGVKAGSSSQRERNTSKNMFSKWTMCVKWHAREYRCTQNTSHTNEIKTKSLDDHIGMFDVLVWRMACGLPIELVVTRFPLRPARASLCLLITEPCVAATARCQRKMLFTLSWCSIIATKALNACHLCAAFCCWRFWHGVRAASDNCAHESCQSTWSTYWFFSHLIRVASARQSNLYICRRSPRNETTASSLFFYVLVVVDVVVVVFFAVPPESLSPSSLKRLANTKFPLLHAFRTHTHTHTWLGTFFSPFSVCNLFGSLFRMVYRFDCDALRSNWLCVCAFVFEYLACVSFPLCCSLSLAIVYTRDIELGVNCETYMIRDRRMFRLFKCVVVALQRIRKHWTFVN